IKNKSRIDSLITLSLITGCVPHIGIVKALVDQAVVFLFTRAIVFRILVGLVFYLLGLFLYSRFPALLPLGKIFQILLIQAYPLQILIALNRVGKIKNLLPDFGQIVFDQIPLRMRIQFQLLVVSRKLQADQYIPVDGSVFLLEIRGK